MSNTENTSQLGSSPVVGTISVKTKGFANFKRSLLNSHKMQHPLQSGKVFFSFLFKSFHRHSSHFISLQEGHWM
ncbi:hypothetical protein Cflav_PD6202 [Pedosphaera parvula Ellin514]|uniref:Uncharacterized protein n=1 Tax=Pedosphaera parvula (strain Ellin514) TaxID=320771 RepID=B9XHN4_PEDPL|nr:hypothetical protein Cflav_PD6202 [Pedosphaera parvula Ellin514]